jgi:hypothetical protein
VVALPGAGVKVTGAASAAVFISAATTRVRCRMVQPDARLDVQNILEKAYPQIATQAAIAISPAATSNEGLVS